MLVAGTGSILLARTRAGRDVRAGGWGFMLGDDGGGHQIGLQGLRAIAYAYDGGPQTHLRTLLAERHGLADRSALIHSVYREGWAIQQMAPLVIEAAEQHDAIAQRILRDQATALAVQARWLVTNAEDIEPRLALLGGLTRSPYYKQTLSDALSDALPGWPIHSPLHPPVMGALRLAEKERRMGGIGE